MDSKVNNENNTNAFPETDKTTETMGVVKDGMVTAVREGEEIEESNSLNEYRRIRRMRFFREILSSHLVKRLWNRLLNRGLWQYNCFWEDDNEECYKAGDFDEEELFIVEQRFIPAKEIAMGDDAIDDSAFPWHKHSLEDFIRLNRKLQECIEIVQRIQTPKDVKRFRNKHRDVYEAYFEIPIRLLRNDDNEYCFGGDGRHRVYVASLHNDPIPVWIVEYRDPKKVSIDYYRKHSVAGTWRFLKEL